jgi:hypothetical protein
MYDPPSEQTGDFNMPGNPREIITGIIRML